MTEEEVARKIEDAVNTFADLQKVGELLAKKGHPSSQGRCLSTAYLSS